MRGLPRPDRGERERYHPQSCGPADRLPRSTTEGAQGGHTQEPYHERHRRSTEPRRHGERRRVFRRAARAAGGRQVKLSAERRENPRDLPGGYKDTFTKYHTINFPATKQVRYYYANKAAVQAAKEGKPLPDGSMLFAEVYAAKLDADRKPLMGGDGFFVAEKLLFYTAMARGAGWGNEMPDMLRNGDWNYAIFTTDKQHRPGVNQAECLACHKPLDNASYTFTLKQLVEAK